MFAENLGVLVNTSYGQESLGKKIPDKDRVLLGWQLVYTFVSFYDMNPTEGGKRMCMKSNFWGFHFLNRTHLLLLQVEED